MAGVKVFELRALEAFEFLILVICILPHPRDIL